MIKMLNYIMQNKYSTFLEENTFNLKIHPSDPVNTAPQPNSWWRATSWETLYQVINWWCERVSGSEGEE